MSNHRYRVYPNTRRARSFAHLNAAITFAQSAFAEQALGDVRNVTVHIGSGSDYVEVGRVTVTGWVENIGWDTLTATVLQRVSQLRRDAERYAAKGCIESAADASEEAVRLLRVSGYRRA